MSSVQIRALKPIEPIQPRLKRRPLGKMLVERGFIKTSDVLVSLGHQRISDAQLGHLLIAQDLISEYELFETLALQHNLPFLTLQTSSPDLDLQLFLPPQECLRLHCVPWMKDKNGTVLAASSPEQLAIAIQEMPSQLHPISGAIASPQDINKTIRASGDHLLAIRAETLVPDALSCRALPAQLKTILAITIPLFLTAVLLKWVTLVGLYQAFFGFSVAMVCLGMALKSSAVAVEMFTRKITDQKRLSLPKKLPCISILIPLHDESEILDALLQRIGLLNYPKSLLDVILVIEADDFATRTNLENADLPNWMRTLIVPPGNITTKPRTMNYALPFCIGDIVGIYDAEDAPHQEQLNEVVARFAAEPEQTACLQAILDFYNARSNALARFFAIEYATWFRLILPGISKLGFAIPLGGTSVFFRRNILEKLHGWDAHNVTEDADLGIRLARAGYRTRLISSVTLEEANNKAWPWIKQRSRWLKGYLITYFTHMRRPLRLLFELGPWKFFGFQAFFLSSISQYMLAPLIWSHMLLYFTAREWLEAAIPAHLLSTIIIAFIFMWLTSLVTYMIAVTRKLHRHLMPWTLLMTLYMGLGTLAIYKGMWELLTRPFYWEKTAHGHSEHDLAQAPSDESESSLSRVTNATEI